MMPKRMQPMGRLDVVSHFPAAPGAEIHCVKVQTEWTLFHPRYIKIEAETAKHFDVIQIYIGKKPTIQTPVPAEAFCIPVPLLMDICNKDETIEVRLRNKDTGPHMVTVTFLGKYTNEETTRVPQGEK